MKRCRNKLAIALAVFALAVGQAWGLPVAEITGPSLGLSRVDAPVSGTGTFTFGVVESSMAAQFGYLTVIGNDAWLVQNLPLDLSADV